MGWLRWFARFPLGVLPSVVLPLLLVGATAEAPARSTVSAYDSLPALPSHAVRELQSSAALEATAVALAESLNAVPLDASLTRRCPAERLQVSWTPPQGGHWGAYLEPVGPVPSRHTTKVNGVVVCQGHPYAFMGFEAWRTEGDWQLAAIPFVSEDGEGHGNHDGDQATNLPPATPPTAVAPPTGPIPLPQRFPEGDIEGYAAYAPQRLCDPSAKPGTLALRNLLLGNHPGTRNLGISRGCAVGGQSEHKEGRALDWGVSAHRPQERDAAETVIAQMMATDAANNRHALARRMGVMYVIWNGRIWSAYRANEGWRTYNGSSPHTDHVHISLSWAGAEGLTSFWSGSVDHSTLFAAPPAAHAREKAAPATHSGHPAPSHADRNKAPHPAPSHTNTRREAWQRTEQERAEAREQAERDQAERQVQRQEREAAQAQARQQAREQHQADRQAKKAAREAEQADRQAKWEDHQRQEAAPRHGERPQRRRHRNRGHRTPPQGVQPPGYPSPAADPNPEPESVPNSGSGEG